MSSDPYANDGYDADAADASDPHPEPPPGVLCPSCGVMLSGLRIGEACPTCGEVIGSRTAMGSNLPSSGKATAALVLGIIAIPGCMLYGVPAVVCGILALVFARQAQADIASGLASPNSRGMANAGFICGAIGLTLGLLYAIVIIGVIVFALMNS